MRGWRAARSPDEIGRYGYNGPSPIEPTPDVLEIMRRYAAGKLDDDRVKCQNCGWWGARQYKDHRLRWGYGPSLDRLRFKRDVIKQQCIRTTPGFIGAARPDLPHRCNGFQWRIGAKPWGWNDGT